MRIPRIDEETLNVLATRTLYVNMFIVLALSFNQWHKPYVFWFVGSIMILAFTGILIGSSKEEEQPS